MVKFFMMLNLLEIIFVEAQPDNYFHQLMENSCPPFWTIMSAILEHKITQEKIVS